MKRAPLKFVMLNDLRKEIESRYELGKPTRGPLSVTGEPYTQFITTGGVDGARKGFEEYAKGRKGKLYWRVPPELEENSGRSYMRLLISDKAPK